MALMKINVSCYMIKFIFEFETPLPY